MLQLESSARMGVMSAQVAHDIRSPLAALEMVTSYLTDCDESSRVLLRSSVERIQDIANQLLRNNVERPLTDTTQQISPILVSSIIEEIVTEKRLQFRARLNVTVVGATGVDSYGIFAEANPVEIKRALSNIINNAVEALQGPGRVESAARRIAQEVVLTIKDNGKGMPPHVLQRLGERGHTHGKGGGNGLGTFHAFQTVENAGGTITYFSEEGKGTVCSIRLRESPKQAWFQQELVVGCARVAVLNDDVSIHEVWNERFRRSASGAELIHFSNSREFEAFISTSRFEGLCLVDYELLGDQHTDLEVIEKLGVEHQSTLVTSRYADAEVMRTCARLDVKVIPKSLAPYVPIRSEKALKLAPDAVLLDDDTLVRTVWRISAKRAGKNLQAFARSNELMTALKDVGRETPIYLDSNLKDGEQGEDLAVKLRGLGFKTIVLLGA